MILRELAAKLGLEVDWKAFAKAGGAIEVVRLGLDKLVDKATEMAGEFVEMVKSTAEAGEKVKHLAQTTGTGTEAIQNLTTAAQFAGVSTDALGGGLGFLSRNMLAAKNGGEEAQKVFRQLGVRATDSSGKLRSTSDVLADVADKFAGMEDGATKSAMAMQLLGRSGRELIPLLNKGSAGIDELSKLAPNLTDEQIEASEELVKSQKELKQVTASLWQGVIAPLIPEITKLVRGYLEWRKANAEITKQRLTYVLHGLVAAVRLVGRAFEVVGDIAGIVKSQWKIALLVMTAALAPFLVELAAAGIAAAATAAGVAVAWAAAALPVIAVLAPILALMALLEDVATYKKAIAEGGTGKNTLFGRYQAMIDEWKKPNANDPWWLKAIKELVEYMERALGIGRQLGVLGNKPGERGKRGFIGRTIDDDEKYETLKAQGGLTGAIAKVPFARWLLADPTKGDKGFFERHGLWDPDAAAAGAAGARGDSLGGPGLRTTTVIHGTTQINVTQREGEDGEQFAQRVSEIADQALQRRIDDAANALPATQ